ncbi:chitinase [Candidatus Magnetobacterium bavaricum]|uniref:chitinase n=1 Tax=Candidatus Magnetobacterium bavaricum TaxID=29290 RepID=A0A0F3GTE8_9BACT|nr:chitinase [Candidatus Magnetobacterium bavaricum]
MEANRKVNYFRSWINAWLLVLLVVFMLTVPVASYGGSTTFIVTPSAGANGKISPSTPQTVAYGARKQFKLTPKAGYTIASVSGCGGTLSGNTYKTAPITANCTVIATFNIISTPTPTTTPTPTPTPTTTKWIMGYYSGWAKDKYPVSAIDWSSLTHLAVAFYIPKSDGTLDETLFIDTIQGPALANEIVAAAHQAGRKVIASIGGADSRASFESATSGATLDSFVANLKNLITKYGYDGLDIDWEPVTPGDVAAVTALVTALRTALPNATLTITANWLSVNFSPDPGVMTMYGNLASQLDQINVMTYKMVGTWSGWSSWHSSALYQKDSSTPTSVDSSVQAYIKAGIPAAKLGVGVGFFGVCYTQPVTAPLQPINGSTIAADDGIMSYAHIMTTYYAANAHNYDNAAKAPYLSFTAATGPEGCSYISYEDEQSIMDKGAYVKANGLGGTIVWTINEGYYNSNNPLLAVMRDALASTHTVTPSVSGANGTISPSTPQTVASGEKTTFTVTPNTGYATSIGGTCSGVLSGNTYTTIAITANCTVSVTFTK